MRTEHNSGHYAIVNDDSSVYLLWHVHDLDGDEDAKLLGVYSSEERAQERIERARSLPGFAEDPEGFEISKYQVDKDCWTEGFVTVHGGLEG